MRFRAQRQQQNQMPEVNLVPMMDVIMTILTFFIIISMSLSDFQSIEIRLPSKGGASGKNAQSETTPAKGTESLVIAINAKRELFIDRRPTTPDQLVPLSRAYLERNPSGKVIIVADKTVPYEAVLQTLTTLRDLGGDRVSLSFQ